MSRYSEKKERRVKEAAQRMGYFPRTPSTPADPPDASAQTVSPVQDGNAPAPKRERMTVEDARLRDLAPHAAALRRAVDHMDVAAAELGTSVSALDVIIARAGNCGRNEAESIRASINAALVKVRHLAERGRKSLGILDGKDGAK